MILIVPCCGKGRGGGHLTRCISLVKDLRAMGRETFLYLNDQNENIVKLLETMEFNATWMLTDTSALPKIDFIVLDRFQTPRDEFIYWKKIAPVIALDEGGSSRKDFDFLIDMLIPDGFIKPAANIYSPGLLVKEITQRTQRNTDGTKEKKVLVTFGQEDSAGLGLKTVNDLVLKNNIEKLNIILLRGALTSNSEIPENVNVIENIPNLAEHLHEYDVVITHYGITAYEAVFAGCEVFLAHPTPYHKKLAKAAGFTTFTQIHGGIKSEQSTNSMKLHGLKFENQTLAGLINSYSPIVSRSCPVCNSENTYAVARFTDRTYRRCSKGGLIFMERLNPPPVEYENDYFFESYKKQYGKTYLDDFDNIKKAGKQRLKIIDKILCRKGDDCEQPTLLDIGCAFGPFLDAAREENYSVFGLDPAKEAVDYVRQKLGIEAVQGLFPFTYSALSDSQHYSVITLWYVIEHFTECKIILNEIKRILKPGGIMAFSAPSYSGISGSSDLKKFLYTSPADHFTVWSPRIVKRVLFRAGFKVKKIIITGHHPERFPILGRFAKSKKSPVYWLLLAISKLFKLGDTFEVFAQLN